MKYRYEIREIDAWYYDDGWNYNTTYLMGELTTSSKDEKRAFTNYLKNEHGITFKKNRTRIEYDGSLYEIVDRKTFEPLFVMIPLF